MSCVERSGLPVVLVMAMLGTVACGGSMPSKNSQQPSVRPPLPVLQVTAVKPNWGAPYGTTTRTIYGTGFSPRAQVTFGGIAATNVNVVNSTAIEATVPHHLVGSVDVIVTDSGGGTSMLPNGYNYVQPPAANSDLSKIRHIIFMLQENRSLDSYFGQMLPYRQQRGFTESFDGLYSGISLENQVGQWVSPFHLQTVCTEDTLHSWDAMHIDWDSGKMDNFLKVGSWLGYSKIDPNNSRAIGYYDWTDLPYYYDLAFQFATSDRHFSSVLANTGPNRMYMLAATSLGNTSFPAPPPGGFPQATIFDLLDQAGISWKYYVQDNVEVDIRSWSTYQRDMGKVVDIMNFYRDVQDDNALPAVIFIQQKSAGFDEHPGVLSDGTGANLQKGVALVKQLIDSLMHSPSWASSVFILSHDEGGGLYDHVPPVPLPAPDAIPATFGGFNLPGTFAQSGFRVPMIVVSPWTRPHFVSHTVRDHTSTLKLIEVRFGLPPLTSRDAAADDMSEFFDFSSPSRLRSPFLPDQATSGTCDLKQEAVPGHY